MSLVNEDNQASLFSFTSSIEQDVWNGEKTSPEYEWWYFDALSDDASEAIVVMFLDNFVFSPRYNAECSEEAFGAREKATSTYPAVAFTYYLHGKPIYRSITEFDPQDFNAADGTPGCRIGDCSFEFKSAPYGNGYAVIIDLPLARNRRVKARFEWLALESDLTPGRTKGSPGGNMRNFVSPRADVTGRITIIDSKGKREKRKFRGTGYHDHSSDTRWMPDTIDEWFWGRAHFPFATAVFYKYSEIGRLPVSKLFLVRDGKLEDLEAEFNFGPGNLRDKFGLGFPASSSVVAKEFSMEITKPTIVESSFFYARSVCEMSLSDGSRTWEASGIAEYLKPEPLKSRWLRRLIDLRIGKGGKRAVLP